MDSKSHKITSLSEVQRFYHGKNVLITGSTGFLGKILVEKLLRSCPGLQSLYLLIRPRHGKDIHTRIEDTLKDPVFDQLKKEVPEFRHKLVLVPADCEKPGLDLTPKDRQMLIEEVNVIFHSAATVRFDERLRSALALNVRGPLHMQKLAAEMEALEVFMHISTAYSNCHLPLIEERFYPFEGNYKQLNEMVDKLTDNEIEELTPEIISSRPNTYTFTKALAEKELRANCANIPMGIFRPAIVISTAKEPVKGWVDNVNGPTGVSVGAASGVLRTLNCNKSVTSDLVPVDLTVNCLIVAAVNVCNSYKQSLPPSDPPIFNYVSSVENRLTWGQYCALVGPLVDYYPNSSTIWYRVFIMTSSSGIYNVLKFFLHTCPAAFVDTLTVLVGKKPKMLNMYRKIHKFASVINFFCNKDIKFCNRRTRELWTRTSEEDRKIFPFSIGDLDWKEYFEEYALGIRRYIFKESDDTLEHSRTRYKRLYYLHQGIKATLAILIIYTFFVRHPILRFMKNILKVYRF